jgi:hypothetical protein
MERKSTRMAKERKKKDRIEEFSSNGEKSFRRE